MGILAKNNIKLKVDKLLRIRRKVLEEQKYQLKIQAKALEEEEKQLVKQEKEVAEEKLT